MIDDLLAFLQTNDFAKGGLFLGLAGAAAVYLRSVPAAIFKRLQTLLTVRVEVRNSNTLFGWLLLALAHDCHLRCRSTVAEVVFTDEGKRVAVGPAAMLSWFRFRGRRFLLFRARDESTIGMEPRESLIVQTMIWNRSLMEELIEAAVRRGDPKQGRSRVYAYQKDTGWSRLSDVALRSIDSVISPHTDRLVADLETFRGAREEYERLGVPYHRGYLFHGPPGNGKTTMVSALARRFDLGLCILNLRECEDDDLMRAMINRPPRCLLVLEDVDCVAPGRKTEGEGVTLSALLNAMDGVATPSGQVVVMTTNHPGELDPALMRPGRVDVSLEFGPPSAEDRARMFRRFLPGRAREESAFVASTRGASMAEVQRRLQERRSGAAPVPLPAREAV